MPAPDFIEKPYLQLGGSSKDMVLLWHAEDTDDAWTVELKGGAEKNWRSAGAPSAAVVKAPGVEAHRVYRAAIAGLKAGEEFQYRVARNGNTVFEANGRARKSKSQPYRFVTFGDCAHDTPPQRAVAYQTSLAKPDFVFMPGDIVYDAGRIPEYRKNYFPVYNADSASAETGAPLIRSIPFIAAPGNHDTSRGIFHPYPDAFAYFLYWDQPLNGPLGTIGAKNTPLIEGHEEAHADFYAGAQARFPRMNNFSFDYGNAHWTILDSNTYVDWTDPEMRAWVKKDLEAAGSAQWRFVGFHHPGFNSAVDHFHDQWMRTLSDVFEAGKVDIVFAGHVHNYQRTFPLTFVTKPQPDGRLVAEYGDVAGDCKLDKDFGDGVNGRPKGVIYIVTGAGGAGLYDPEMQDTPGQWQPFTNKYVAQTHSFTVVDIDGSKLKARQISESGAELDSFQISK
jgi:3',5'-cyclic AMP phosphodiesterase CpdA